MNTLADAEAHLASLTVRVREIERRLRVTEDWVDTRFMTPWWKRAVFRLDGWPATRLVERPAWRPWRRWWRS